MMVSFYRESQTLITNWLLTFQSLDVSIGAFNLS